MRTRQTMTISLPPEMIREVERVRKAEHRTRSELLREALRAYFTARRTFPTYTPTAAELRAIEKGRAEMRRGEYLTLNDFFRTLDRSRPKTPAKGGRTRTAR